MTSMELLRIVSAGENSNVQFKREFDNKEKIAAEIIAFLNAKGGMIIFGVEDRTGDIVGLEYADVQDIGNKISNIANDLLKPKVYVTTDVVSIDNETGQKNVLIV